ncbi:MAG: NAD-dependent dihydropyrimidine dehydrogenase subunit PreA [Chloroflexi bacterium]|nr:NAD-dependent dihydropyrimidine dehydrogenase subunit PreA [Chloroflexota bacterium]
MSSLEIEFANLKFVNPFLLASAPPTRNAEMLARAFEQGWAGAVIKTIPSESLMQRGLTHEPKPVMAGYYRGSKRLGMGNISITGDWRIEEWAKALPSLRAEFPDRIVLGSFGAETIREDWQRMAKQLEDAGVDGIELDLSCTHATLGKEIPLIIGENPQLIAEVVSWVTDAVKIPVIPKLPATVYDWKGVLEACKEARAKGVASINTLSAFMGFDIESMNPLLNVNGLSAYCGYSGPAIKPIALRVVSQIYKTGILPVSGIGGISNWQDAIEFILLGAKTIQVCTAVMWNGYGIVQKMLRGLLDYMDKRNILCLNEIVGFGDKYVRESVFELKPDANLRAIVNEKCSGCRKCVIACCDGAYQAITMDDNKKAIIDKNRCTGCGLCVQVCPSNAITMESTF